jgi:hypothetical protein
MTLDPSRVRFYTDSKEVSPGSPLKSIMWAIVGLTVTASICSEIFVRCGSLFSCITNTNHYSDLTTTIVFNCIFNCTFASIMVLRILINSYLKKYYSQYARRTVTGALVTFCLLLLLATNQRAKAFLAGRLRNLVASMGLEPAWGRHRASMGREAEQGRNRVQPVAVAMVELGGNVATSVVHHHTPLEISEI